MAEALIETKGSATAVAQTAATAQSQSQHGRVLDVTRQTELIGKLAKFQKAMSDGFVGREEEAKVISLAMLTDQHVVMVGPPGTAKSAIARRFAQLTCAKCFTYLLTKYTEPSELFGSLDVVAMRDKGEYKRITKDKLPEANDAFLDEFFNGNSAILNTLLTIMNERIMYDGTQTVRVPLHTIISATNQVPEDKALAAVYDRFLFRQFVQPVRVDQLNDMLKSGWARRHGNVSMEDVTIGGQKMKAMQIGPKAEDGVKPVLSMQDIDDLQSMLGLVDMSRVRKRLVYLFGVLEDKGIEISNRRQDYIQDAVAANALLNGRLQPTEQDLMVLKYTVPKTEDELKVVMDVLSEIKTPEEVIGELNSIKRNLDGAMKGLDPTSPSFLGPKLIEMRSDLRKAREEVLALGEAGGTAEIDKLTQGIVKQIDGMQERIRQLVGGGNTVPLRTGATRDDGQGEYIKDIDQTTDNYAGDDDDVRQMLRSR